MGPDGILLFLVVAFLLGFLKAILQAAGVVDDE
jgi:hypothetical protein